MPMRMLRAVSHQDLATRLGVHQSTISRGLHNDPRIPAETRKRIRALAAEMGYLPNTLLSEVAASRWQRASVQKGTVIAYIDTIVADGYVGGLNLTPALKERALELGYQLTTFLRPDFSTSARLQRALRSRGITDVIIGPIFKESLLVELQWEKFICVQFSPGFFPLPLNSVTKDHFGSVLLAWQKAVERGYRRIGVVLLNHPVKIMDDVLRSSAVRACQYDLYKYLPRLRPFLYSAGTVRQEAFVRWVNTTRPDVIIGFSDAHNEMFHSKFQRWKPYISLHAAPDAELSGIPDDTTYCAREAVNLLHFCRRTHQWGIPERRINHVIEPLWVEGTSLPAKKLA
jgi:LacI family transcriptional regulator